MTDCGHSSIAMTNPLPTPTVGVAAIENALADCQAEFRKAIARAESIDPGWDLKGRRYDATYRQAIGFMRIAASLGMALAKLNGTHNTTITVTHRDARPGESAAEQGQGNGTGGGG
ncbi:MAG: hypothetical protein JSR60_12895 [Proteobacteria bacterium]|nr:hypothetical protein [Pseudomonadota bacterium]